MGRLLPFRGKRREKSLFPRGGKASEERIMHRWEREWNARRDDNSLVPDLRPFRTTFSRSNPTRIERKRFRWRVMSFPDLSGLRCVRTTYKDAPISVYAHACTRDGCIASWIGSPRLYYSWSWVRLRGVLHYQGFNTMRGGMAIMHERRIVGIPHGPLPRPMIYRVI